MKNMRKDWMLGFLGFMSIYGVAGLLKGGDWTVGLWLFWVVWFYYFIPVKNKD